MRFHNDPGKYVAHYTSGETALEHILQNNTLRFGPLSNTNDPRESKIWNFAVSGELDSDLQQVLNKHKYEFDHFLKAGKRVLCVCEDRGDADKLRFASRSYGKARMWSQYADNHTGICLIFDKQDLDSQISKQFSAPLISSGSIDYGDFDDVTTNDWFNDEGAFLLNSDELSAKGVEQVMKEHSDKFITQLFFRKNLDWSSENEFRWLVSAQEEETFVNYGDSLRAILLGVDFPKKSLDEVFAYCVDKDLCVSRIVWVNGKPGVHWLEPSQIFAPEYGDIREFLGFDL